MSALEKAGDGLTPSMEAQAVGIRELIRQAGGSADVEFLTNLFFRTHKTAKVFQGGDIDPLEDEEIVARATGVALAAFKPTNPVEGMFAAQAVMLHNLSMEAGRRAMIPEQHPDVASKLRKDAANGARVFNDTVDALARYRGKAPQVVRVERVVVNEGGQAVVGVVSPGTSALSSPPAQQAIAQDRAGDGIGDAIPVVAGDRGEGEGA